MNRSFWLAVSSALLLLTACGPKNRGRRPPGDNMFNSSGGGSAATGGKYTLATTSAGSDLKRLTFDPIDEEKPVLSPDGGTLLVGLRVFQSDGSPNYPGIISIDPNNGGNRTMMTETSFQSDRAAWTPDGSTFVYATNAPGGWTLVRANSRMPMAGYSVIVPSSQAPLADYPSVAPDGLVAFTMSVNKTSVIATVRIDGTGMQMIQQGTFASFSPDGQWIAFVRDVAGSDQLFLSDRSGGNTRQLTFGKASHLWPTWSPDGRFVTFASNRGTEYLDRSQQRNHIWAIAAAGGQPVQLTNGNADCGFPMWGVDGNIYFNSNQSGQSYDIWKMRVHVEGMGKSI